MLQDRIELLFSLQRKLLSLNRIESSAHDSFCSDFDYTPSQLEPELELKFFQLGTARLVTFFPSARNRKLAENKLKFYFF